MISTGSYRIKTLRMKNICSRGHRTAGLGRESGRINVHLSHIQTQEQDTGCPSRASFGGGAKGGICPP